MNRWRTRAVLCAALFAAGACERQPAGPAAGAPGPNAAEAYRAAWGQIDDELNSAASFSSFDASGLKLQPGSGFASADDVSRLLRSRRSVVTDLMNAGSVRECDFGWKVDRTKPQAERTTALVDAAGALRRAARLLNADAARAWSEGDADGAVDRIAAIYALSAHTADEPVLIIALTNAALIMLADVAAQQMAAGGSGKPLSEGQKARLLAALERLDRADPAGIARAAKAEGSDASTDQQMGQAQLKLTNDLARTRRALGGS